MQAKTNQESPKAIRPSNSTEFSFRYYLNHNAQRDGYHVAHVAGRQFLAARYKQIFIGRFNLSSDAFDAASKHFPRVRHCDFCIELLIAQCKLI